MLADGRSVTADVSRPVTPHRAAPLGPVQCVPVPSSSASTSSSSDAAAAGAADAMWLTDLSGVLSGWQWQHSSCTVTVPAGRVITGVGVAVQCSSSSSGVADVLGVLGSVRLEVVGLADVS
jgi:hypothetical protein